MKGGTLRSASCPAERASAHEHAAVDVQGRTRHVGARIACEEEAGVGDLLSVAEAAETTETVPELP